MSEQVKGYATETIKQGFDAYLAATYPHGYTADQHKHLLMAFYGGAGWMFGSTCDLAELDEASAMKALSAIKDELNTTLKRIAR
jgi:hypothetical protein